MPFYLSSITVYRSTPMNATFFRHVSMIIRQKIRNATYFLHFRIFNWIFLINFETNLKTAEAS